MNKTSFTTTVATARKSQPASGGRPDAAGTSDGELVAVLTAAVAAASGMAPDAFRIAGFAPVKDRADTSRFNTPIWGRIERTERCRRIR